jgi:quercetin dioxygenase-like cupin family protein
MRIIALALATMTAASLPAWAQSSTMDLVSGPNAVKWGPVPPSLPKGAMIAVLSGDPFKDGPYVVRLKLPENYRFPAHHHPTTENVTVLSGSFHAGMGDKFDADKGQTFAPGGFVSMPAGMNHYAWATTETIVQVHGKGPFAIVYVNPADDPNKEP